MRAATSGRNLPQEVLTKPRDFKSAVVKLSLGLPWCVVFNPFQPAPVRRGRAPLPQGTDCSNRSVPTLLKTDNLIFNRRTPCDGCKKKSLIHRRLDSVTRLLSGDIGFVEFAASEYLNALLGGEGLLGPLRAGVSQNTRF